MRIFNWIREIGNGPVAERRDASGPQHFTAAGHAVIPEWRSRWTPNETGLYETRKHVGQSAEGFHAGVEIAYRMSDPIAGGEPYATPERARQAAIEMEEQVQPTRELAKSYETDLYRWRQGV